MAQDRRALQADVDVPPSGNAQVHIQVPLTERKP
jgi:hypothetical protein